MSEFVPEDDPEPLSGGLQEFINTSIIDAGHYVDDGLGTHYRETEQQQQEDIADAERRKQEIRDIGALCVQADTLFKLHESSGDRDDQKIERGDVTLRRKCREYIIDGREIYEKLYFFTDNRDQAGYCRAWKNYSEQVNWCNKEQRHEPAAEVQAHLGDAFPPAPESVAPRRFGRLALPHILRQKV